MVNPYGQLDHKIPVCFFKFPHRKWGGTVNVDYELSQGHWYTNFERRERDILNWSNSCQKVNWSVGKFVRFAGKANVIEIGKFWELKDLQLLIKIQNYQHDAQGLKCQGGRALRRNCKQPFNLFIDIRKEWHLYAYMQLCVSKDLLRQKYLYLRLRGMRRWHFCRLYVKCCECGKSVQINFFKFPFCFIDDFVNNLKDLL